MSRRSCLRRLGATKLYLNSRSWDGAAHGIGQWSMEEEHPVRSHRWPHRLPPFFCLFLSRIFAKRVSSSHATFHQHTFPLSLLPPPRTGWHGTIRRYVFNESRSIVRDCSVRLASGPKIGEEGENRVFHVRHLAGRRMSVKWVPRGARRKREKGERERERPYSPMLVMEGSG